jgi:NTE family protein
MTTAFVLSGGGSLGAVQVGMLQELAARGIRPDLLVGTSAGALNAAYVAGHGAEPAALDRLAAIWRALRRRDVFPLSPAARPPRCRCARPRCAATRRCATSSRAT